MNRQVRSNTVGYVIENSERDEVQNYSLRNFGADLFIWWDKVMIKLGVSEPKSLSEKMVKFGYSGYVATAVASADLLDEGKSLGSCFLTELAFWVARYWFFLAPYC